MPPKRARTQQPSTQRVVLNVGGRCFETSLPTVARSSYLAGLIDSTSWDDDTEHREELFIDRDPTVFEQVLRVMRQGAVLGGLLPENDAALCSAIIAEADFYGVDTFLDHVKIRSAKHESDDPALSDEEAVAYFDTHLGAIPDALESGVLPRRYFGPRPPKKKILQLLPTAEPMRMQFILLDDEELVDRDAWLNTADGRRDHIREVTKLQDAPTFSRRVACMALIEEDGIAKTEAMIVLEDEDRSLLMGACEESDWRVCLHHFNGGERIAPMMGIGTQAWNAFDERPWNQLVDASVEMGMAANLMLTSAYMKSPCMRGFINDRNGRRLLGLWARLRVISEDKNPHECRVWESMNLG